MLKALKEILVIQELDIKMIRLMRLKKERQNELNSIFSLRDELKVQMEAKEKEIMEIKKNVNIHEGNIAEIKEKLKKYDAQQSKIKKVDEFNALSQEISRTERERVNAEQRLSDVFDNLASQEESLESMNSTEESSQVFENELTASISKINDEGRKLLEVREEEVKKADSEVRPIYEKLLANKRDRVVVPIEKRTCSGCHILLTAQHENLVRKGERLVFCEHCSRILFWQESDVLEGTGVATKRRRRRTTPANA
jgi:predicted  nucleic acid-binding Zn-ribbon protein